MSQRNYRRLALELDPNCKLKRASLFGHSAGYSVFDSEGTEIGYTDGNERGASWAWLRAYAVLKRRKEKVDA